MPDPEKIKRWLGRALQGKDGAPADIDVISESKNPSSTHWVALATIGRERKKLFVKQHVTPNLYEQERDALAALSLCFESAGPFGVPNMVAFSDQLNCIALDWLEGQTIGPAIRRAVSLVSSPAASKAGQDTAFSVGQWLQRLRAATKTAASPLPVDEMLARFRKMISMIVSSQALRLSQNSGAQVFQRFESSLNSADPQENCLVHNDFWFDHIWTVGSRLVVIDFGRAQVGPAGRDAIQFYCRLRDISLFNPLVSVRALDRIVESFLRGYGSLDVDSEIGRMWELWTCAEQLLGLAKDSPAGSVEKMKYHLQERALARKLSKTSSQD